MEATNRSLLIVFKRGGKNSLFQYDLVTGRIMWHFVEDNEHLFLNFAISRNSDDVVLVLRNRSGYSVCKLHLYEQDEVININLLMASYDDIKVPKKVSILSGNDGITGFLFEANRQTIGAILYLHGGPGHQASASADPLIRYFLNLGFSVLDIDYHGSSGHGDKFQDSINQHIGHLELIDTLAGMNFLKSRFDRLPVGVCGNSYGGFLALQVLASSQNQFEFGIDVAGVVDWTATLEQLPAFWEKKRDKIYRRFGNPYRDFAYLQQISPVSYSQRIRVPIMIVHGQRDARVKIEQVENFFSRLKENNKNVQLTVAKNAGHDVLATRQADIIYRKIASFLECSLKS